MSRVIKRRAKQHIPGGGFDANGAPKQGKVQVWGKIVVTNYDRSGENLTASDLGLRTIEWLDLKVDDAMGSPQGHLARLAHFSSSVQQFYITEGGVNMGATEDPVLSFNAVGDDAADVELL